MFPLHLYGSDRLRQSLQLDGAERDELVAARVVPWHERSRTSGLPTGGSRAKARALHDWFTEVIARFFDAVSRCDTDAHGQRQLFVGGIVARDRSLDADRRVECGTDAREDDHDPVAQRLDLVTAVGSDRLTQQTEVHTPKIVGAGGTEPSRRCSRVDEVREQHRNADRRRSSPRLRHNRIGADAEVLRHLRRRWPSSPMLEDIALLTVCASDTMWQDMAAPLVSAQRTTIRSRRPGQPSVRYCLGALDAIRTHRIRSSDRLAGIADASVMSCCDILRARRRQRGFDVCNAAMG